MLTIELLKGNNATKDIPEATLLAIVDLSKNDENIVIGKKTKEIWDSVDKDIKDITGIEKPTNVKSFDFLKTTITDLGKKAEGAKDVESLKTQISDLEAEKVTLLDKIKKGSGDETLKARVSDLEKQIKDKDGEIETIRTSFATEKDELAKKLADHQKESMSLQLKQKFNEHMTSKGLKFKKMFEADDSAKKILQDQLNFKTDNLINSLKPDFIDDGNGGKQMVFRDADGQIMRNKDNNLNPFTAGELYQNHISELLEENRSQGGGGSGGSGGGGTPSVLDLSGAKSQMEANKLIVNHLMKIEGLAKTHPEFSKKQNEIFIENKIGNLPLRD